MRDSRTTGKQPIATPVERLRGLANSVVVTRERCPHSARKLSALPRQINHVAVLGNYRRPANPAVWAIGRLRRGRFYVRRIVWGRLMARAEQRDGETICRAMILTERK
jgi:hypothetical protein